MTEENKIVNSLWIGNKLSEMELLTIASFTKHGHKFHLWVYNSIENVPENVIIKNANDIIPEDNVFVYDKNSNIDWGKGSYAGFSDIFRYKLLHENGGWWVDMDVTCLQPFDFSEIYFFRNHWKYDVVGNVMKCPKGSELMKLCYNESLEKVNKHNTNWHLPIEILNKHVKELNLKNYIQRGLINLDMSHTIKPYFHFYLPIPKDWIALHWIHSAQQKEYFENSTFDTLLQQYNITSFAIKHSFWSSFKKIIK